MPTRLAHAQKALTHIKGFDQITRGGLPRERATLLIGGPGCGKTIFALQSLINGARIEKEPGVFVAFEESAGRIAANASAFGWNLDELREKDIFFLDAQPTADLVQLGAFDLIGILAALGEKVDQMGAKRIVFDSVDVALSLLNNVAAERQEIYRLHEWLLERRLTSLITTKRSESNRDRASLLQYMVDCAVSLNHEVVNGVSQRTLRVIKFRGATFSENEAPLIIGEKGMQIAGIASGFGRAVTVSNERVSSGVDRLDTMLGGGYFRAASILVTGSPGTAKTTLSGSFAAAACKRGERTLFISFDSDPEEIVRNLASVNIQLAPHQESGMLKMVGANCGEGSPEVHYLRIQSLAAEHEARCIVIDPLSALGKNGPEASFSVVERLMRWAKEEGITSFSTSLLAGAAPEVESTPLQISTIADTWIHLSYKPMAGERNRALTIIKSRGTEHSNQVRELILSANGISLADVFTAGGEVLMGTLRFEKEAEAEAERARSRTAAARKLLEFEFEESELSARLRELERELALKRNEREAFAREADQAAQQVTAHDSGMRRLRSADSQGEP